MQDRCGNYDIANIQHLTTTKQRLCVAIPAMRRAEEPQVGTLRPRTIRHHRRVVRMPWLVHLTYYSTNFERKSRRLQEEEAPILEQCSHLSSLLCTASLRYPPKSNTKMNNSTSYSRLTKGVNTVEMDALLIGKRCFGRQTPNHLFMDRVAVDTGQQLRESKTVSYCC